MAFYDNFVPYHYSDAQALKNLPTRKVITADMWNSTHILFHGADENANTYLNDINNYLFKVGGAQPSAGFLSTLETKAEASDHLNGITYNSSTGVFTITRENGTSYTIQTDIHKVVTNWRYDPVTQRLILTNSDGTTTYVDLSALITQYEFQDSTSVGFSVQQSGKVQAFVKPNYLQQCQSAVASCESSEDRCEELKDYCQLIQQACGNYVDACETKYEGCSDLYDACTTEKNRCVIAEGACDTVWTRIGNLTVTAEAVAYDQPINVTRTSVGQSYNFHFKIPRGATGAQGDPGTPGEPGSPGQQGNPGPAGKGISSMVMNNTTGAITVTYTDGTSTVLMSDVYAGIAQMRSECNTAAQQALGAASTATTAAQTVLSAIDDALNEEY